ncbi:hypothetical protein KEM52_000122 [Ascosphaera acerosa]|nr:hypothetical protein KEM52_000122 [Ascosphaera acerosa]
MSELATKVHTTVKDGSSDEDDDRIANVDLEVVERFKDPGAIINRGHKIVALEQTPFPPDAKLLAVDINDIDGYTHIGRTPQGDLLMPQSILVRIGVMSSEYAATCRTAFSWVREAYLDSLKRTNLTKHGYLRSAMSSAIAGSARLVAVPQVKFPRHIVCVSRVLADGIKTCYVPQPDEELSVRYHERTLKDGDWCILVRPPSLTVQSVQPVMVKIWNHHALEIHPELFTTMHGDYDDDEAHLYPVYDESSVKEAVRWHHEGIPTFNEARALMFKFSPGWIKTHPDDFDISFVRRTTVSSEQLRRGLPKRLLLGDQTRNKNVHIKGMMTRFGDATTGHRFVKESIRDVVDIMTQQLSQSTVGEMTRLAHVTSLLFYRDADGRLMCQTRDGPLMLSDVKQRDVGMPSNRAGMLLCLKAQQSKLDAYRVGLADRGGFDMITDLFKGREATVGDQAYFTVCRFDDLTGIDEKLIKWKVKTADTWVCLVPPGKLSPLTLAQCNLSYSPLVLRHVPVGNR